MHVFAPASKDQLRVLIENAMAQHGPACDLNGIDVSNIATFENLFEHLPFVGDISRWNTSNVKNMMGMFLNSPFSGDISNWNTAACETMQSMFKGSTFTVDLSRWDMRRVLSTAGMFEDSAFTGNVDNWEFVRLLNIKAMFKNCPFAGDISSWTYSGKLDVCFGEAFASPFFQSDMPRFPVNKKHDKIAAFHPSYRGSLHHYALEDAAYLFENKTAFNAHLRERAQQGLSFLHVAKALVRETPKPRWMPSCTHERLHQEKRMCQSLGMDAGDTLRHVYAVYCSTLLPGASPTNNANVSTLQLPEHCFA